MTANGDDITIRIGAEADSNLDAAQRQIVASFKAMEGELRNIGTDAANELADKMYAVAKGVKTGKIETADAAEFARLLDEAAKAGSLTDAEIDRIDSGMSNLARNSRSVADAIADSANRAERNREAFGKIQAGLESASPAVGRITGGFGKWLGSTKSVSGIIGKMPRLLGGVLGGLGAIIGAMAAIGKMMKDYQRSLLEIDERNFRRKGEEIAWAKEVAEARISREREVAMARLENAQAIADAEHEIEMVAMDVDAARKSSVRTSELNRRIIEKNVAVEKERLAISKQLADLQREQNRLAEEQSKDDERRVALGKQITEEMQRRDELQAKTERFGGMRSQYSKAKEEAMAIEDPAERQRRLDSLRADYKNRFADMWEGLKTSLGGSAVGLANDFDPEEAEEQYQKVLDAFAEQGRKVERMMQETAQMDAAEQMRKAQGDTIESQKRAAEARYNAVGEKADLEAKRENAERDERVEAKRLELQGDKNRLTAMGLGGGNIGADAAKDTAKNTSKMVELLKDLKRNTEVKGLGAPSGAKQLTAGDTSWAM